MSNKWIVVAVISAVVLLSGCFVISTNNTAIGYEESIKTAQSGIQVQEKREYDLITKLVQVVQANSKYESTTLEKIVEARSAAQKGNVGQAMTAINVVAEQYPDLKANSTYTQLMTELSVSENLKTQYRNTYNDTVQDYTQYTRRFPNTLFLSWMGYTVVKYEHLEFQETQLPDQLFPNP